jgi:hypothetical protein
VRGPDDVSLQTQVVDDGAPTFGLVFQPNGTHALFRRHLVFACVRACMLT